MATKLGEVAIYIPKGATVGGVVLLDENRKTIGAAQTIMVRPGDGDLIQIEVLHKPE